MIEIPDVLGDGKFQGRILIENAKKPDYHKEFTLDEADKAQEFWGEICMWRERYVHHLYAYNGDEEADGIYDEVMEKYGLMIDSLIQVRIELILASFGEA